MRWVVGDKAAHGCAASPSQMGRFETQWLGSLSFPANGSTAFMLAVRREASCSAWTRA